MLRTPGGVWVTTHKLAALMAAGVRRRFSYLGELAIRGSFLVVTLYIFSQLWRTVAEQLDARPAGYGIQQLVFYLAFAESIVFTTPGMLEPELDRELRTGDIAYRIARPLAFPLQHLATSLGDRSVRFAFNLLLGTAVAQLLVGSLAWHAAACAAAVIAALLALLVDELITLSISLSSFWIESTFGVHMLYRRGNLLLGGALVPIAAYPDWLADICRALPFQYFVERPAALFVGSDASGFQMLLATQLAWACGTGALVLVLYRAGLRRVIAQGG
ncbi:MAG TPA: ABC-2 family transporter protein [Polyangiales bacterium]|nr:ABC-2 family transporter protein [Polyangiales bacterium]